MPEIKPVGLIHSPYGSKDDAPIQGAFRPDGVGWVEVFPEFEAGLQDIEGFSHVILLYLFDRAGAISLVRPTLLDDTPHGIFASRHPGRPNAIGMTIVRLLKREKSVLRVGGIDTLDLTPVVDIKPYVPRFDCFPGAAEGWFQGKNERPKPEGRE
jgi:tRNA-Thr(GGU) m(6)t(6)A37 methyltransferase TsaA